MTPKNRRTLLLAAILGGLIGLGFFIGRTLEQPATDATPARATTPAHATAPANINAIAPANHNAHANAIAPTHAIAADTPTGPQPLTDRPPLESPAETYRKIAIYPPDSRPLTPHAADLLDPDRRHERPQTDPDDPTLTALFTADRYHLIGEDTLTVILDVRRADQPAPVTLQTTTVHLPDGRTEPYTLHPQDGRHIALIRPADYHLAAPTRLHITATFDYGQGPRTARLRADYTPHDAIPGCFTGKHTDALVDGSLIITLEADISLAGLYIVDANLYAPTGEPIATARYKEPLTEGRHPIPLRFFGKILNDAGHDGPYLIGELRAALSAPSQTPSRISLPPFPGQITTAPYAATQFSPAEWDAPEKHDRLRRLERLEALGGAPRIGRPRAPDSPNQP